MAQKDAAMSMLYKCIEVMNRQLLTARLGPYTDGSLADYAESEEFIIGIILDRFGISPVLDEFDNQPVYLPGQRGFNPENCAVEFPQHSGHGDGYGDESYSQNARFIFNPQATLPHSLYSSQSDISQDVPMGGQGETAEYDTPLQNIPCRGSTAVHILTSFLTAEISSLYPHLKGTIRIRMDNNRSQQNIRQYGRMRVN